MAKAPKRIRITSSGIYGAPTKENPTGEMPIGFEFDTDGDLPAGWVGRAVVVGEDPAEGSIFVANPDDGSDSGKARAELIEKAEAEFDRLKSAHADETRSIVSRAEKAEADLQHANEQIEALNLKLNGTDQSGANGNGDAATADEIKSAVALLDAKTDAHWTAAGLPAVEAVAELTGKTVTRKAIEEATPDAKRPTE